MFFLPCSDICCTVPRNVCPAVSRPPKFRIDGCGISSDAEPLHESSKTNKHVHVQYMSYSSRHDLSHHLEAGC